MCCFIRAEQSSEGSDTLIRPQSATFKRNIRGTRGKYPYNPLREKIPRLQRTDLRQGQAEARPSGLTGGSEPLHQPPQGVLQLFILKQSQAVTTPPRTDPSGVAAPPPPGRSSSPHLPAVPQVPQEVLGGRQPHLLLGFGDVPEEIEEGAALPQHPARVGRHPPSVPSLPLRHAAASARGAAAVRCPPRLFRGSGDGAGAGPSVFSGQRAALSASPRRPPSLRDAAAAPPSLRFAPWRCLRAR